MMDIVLSKKVVFENGAMIRTDEGKAYFPDFCFVFPNGHRLYVEHDGSPHYKVINGNAKDLLRMIDSDKLCNELVGKNGFSMLRLECVNDSAPSLERLAEIKDVVLKLYAESLTSTVQSNVFVCVGRKSDATALTDFSCFDRYRFSTDM